MQRTSLSVLAFTLLASGSPTSWAGNQSLCDRPLPPDRILNARNFELSCGAGVSHYIRQAENFDYKEWRKYEGWDSLEGQQKAQAVRQKGPEPQWTGSITYPTIEEWDYDTIEPVVRPGCPTHRDYYTVQVEDDGMLDKSHDREVAGRNSFSSSSTSSRSGLSSGSGLRVSSGSGGTIGTSKVGGGGGLFSTSSGGGSSYRPTASRTSKDDSTYHYGGGSSSSDDDNSVPVAPIVHHYHSETHFRIITDPCPTPVQHHFSRTCSMELLSFSAQYVRPTKDEWNPSSPHYLNIIPNKYDLFPNEHEDIQIINNRQRSHDLSPEVSVPEAYNDYAFDMTLDGVHSAGAKVSPIACAIHTNHHLDVAIKTLQRKFNMPTPNVLQVPLDEYGRAEPWFLYRRELDPQGHALFTRPDTLRFTNGSEVMMRALKRQAMNEADANGGETQASNVEVQKSEAPNGQWLQEFWADSYVRIKLIQPSKIFGQRAQLEAEPLSLKDSKIERDNDHYEIDLLDEQHPFYVRPYPQTRVGGFLARHMPFTGAGESFDLEPKTKYLFFVSVKHNVPFYKHDCKNADDDACFSKALQLEFDSTVIDHRTVGGKFYDFLTRP